MKKKDTIAIGIIERHSFLILIYRPTITVDNMQEQRNKSRRVGVKSTPAKRPMRILPLLVAVARHDEHVKASESALAGEAQRDLVHVG